MPDTAYFWIRTLNVEQAMNAHQARTGQPAKLIVCRNADEPAVAAQLRPETVELHANNYVQRGTLYLAALLIGLLCALVPAPAHAAPVADAQVTTTVSRVYPFQRNGAAYCNSGLANMTTLTNVFGPECQARRGQRVVLYYSEYVVESVTCNLRGCRTASKPVRTLQSWYIVP